MVFWKSAFKPKLEARNKWRMMGGFVIATEHLVETYSSLADKRDELKSLIKCMKIEWMRVDYIMSGKVCQRECQERGDTVCTTHARESTLVMDLWKNHFDACNEILLEYDLHPDSNMQDLDGIYECPH